VTPQAPELDCDESTKGRERRGKETCSTNLSPLGKVWRKEQGAGKYWRHMLSRAGEWSTRVFWRGKELGTDGFCCRYDRYLL